MCDIYETPVIQPAELPGLDLSMYDMLYPKDKSLSVKSALDSKNM